MRWESTSQKLEPWLPESYTASENGKRYTFKCGLR